MTADEEADRCEANRARERATEATNRAELHRSAATEWRRIAECAPPNARDVADQMARYQDDFAEVCLKHARAFRDIEAKRRAETIAARLLTPEGE